jgi:hypothetical protein
MFRNQIIADQPSLTTKAITRWLCSQSSMPIIMVDIDGAGRQSDSSLYNNSEVSFIDNLW